MVKYTDWSEVDYFLPCYIYYILDPGEVSYFCPATEKVVTHDVTLNVRIVGVFNSGLQMQYYTEKISNGIP